MASARQIAAARRNIKKAQAVAARKRRRFVKRRGLTKTGLKNLRKGIRKNPKKAVKLFGTAVALGGTTGMIMSRMITGSNSFTVLNKKGHMRKFRKKYG